MVGLGGLEPPASSLSGIRSNQAELQALFGNYESRIINYEYQCYYDDS